MSLCSTGRSARNETEEDVEDEPSAVAMKTMDIFAGCGGLSEGMHQAGVADTRWAVEYEAPAADAFQLNNPEAKVFCNNCNVLLQVCACFVPAVLALLAFFYTGVALSVSAPQSQGVLGVHG